MRRWSVAATAACVGLASCTAWRGGAETAGAGRTGMVCLASQSIDHTEIVDDSTIKFFMRDRSVWSNTLAWRCTGLRNDSRGFTYEPTDPGSDSICANLVVITTNTAHNSCALGAFTRLS